MLLDLVEETKEPYVLLVFAKCVYASTSSDLNFVDV
jgi:hypothetical protein